MSIALYDDFANSLGQFANYQTYDAAQQTQLGLQKHVNLRSFEQTPIATAYRMLDFDNAPTNLAFFEGLLMSVLEAAFVVQAGEQWTTGTIAPQSDKGYFKGISLTCAIGVTTTTSVMLASPINVSQFTNTDYLSLALPVLPLPSLTPASCFLDLTSDPSGAFPPDSTDSIPLSASTSTLINGDSEARFPLSLLVNLDRRHITGVRFRITATGTCTFRCLAIRVLASTWDFAPIDQNTLYDRLEATVPPTGNPAQATTFPIIPGLLPSPDLFPSDNLFPSSNLFPSPEAPETLLLPSPDLIPSPGLFPSLGGPESSAAWPVLFFTESGTSGPTPVDMEVGAIIQTGLNVADNRLSLYFRELSLTPSSFGSETAGAMANLNGQLMVQLDATRMANLEGVGLNALSMSALEALGRLPDATAGVLNDLDTSHFIGVTIHWGVVSQITLFDQSGNLSYPLTTPMLANNSKYYFLVTMVENGLRAQIYPSDITGVIDWTHPVFDTTTVIDDSFVRRRRGRFGWFAELGEGDTYVQALRPRHVVYGEYESAPFLSDRAVTGTRLYVDSSPDQQLFTGVTPTPGAPATTITLDVTKSRSGKNLKIQADGSVPLQGLVTDVIRFENFYDTSVEFDILAPATVSLLAYLVGETRLNILSLPLFVPNRTSHITLPLETLGPLLQPGPYSLHLVQAHSGANTWYIDNLSIRTKTVSWQARSKLTRPFLKANDMLNDPSKGLVLGRGTELQVRGQALGQDAFIMGLKILPQYAEIGNFVWKDQQPVYGAPPVPSFTTTTPAPRTARCDGTGSTASAGIAGYAWSFGDGNFGAGSIVSHEYQVAGTYVVGLTIIDTLNQKITLVHSVTVS